MTDEHELAREWQEVRDVQPECKRTNRCDRMAAELNRLKAENEAAQDLRMRLYGIIGELTIKIELINQILRNSGQAPHVQQGSTIDERSTSGPDDPGASPSPADGAAPGA